MEYCEEFINDVINFFMMVGASNELAERGFDTGDVMTLEYCNDIIDLCKKYNVEYDENKADGILFAEDNIFALFKEELMKKICEW